MALPSLFRIKPLLQFRHFCSISISNSNSTTLDYKQKIQNALSFLHTQNLNNNSPTKQTLNLCHAATELHEHGMVLQKTITKITGSEDSYSFEPIRSFLHELKNEPPMLFTFIDELKALPNLRDEEFYCYSITLYGHVKMMDRAIEAFVEMEKWGVKRSTKSLNALLRAGNFAKQYVEMSKIFYEFPAKYGIKPDLDTYNIVIESFVDSSKPEFVFKIFEDMDKNGVEPDEITLNTALSGFNRQQKYSDAEKVLKIFEKLGPQLGLHIYNSKIRTLCDTGKTMEAKAVFEEISSRGMKLNRYTYQCLVFAYYKEENVEETTRFFNEMYEKGFEPDFIYSTYKKIIQFLCESGDFETASKVCFCGLSKDYTFSGATLIPLLEGLESIGRVGLALKLAALVPYITEWWKPATKGTK